MKIYLKNLLFKVKGFYTKIFSYKNLQPYGIYTNYIPAASKHPLIGYMLTITISIKLQALTQCVTSLSQLKPTDLHHANYYYTRYHNKLVRTSQYAQEIHFHKIQLCITLIIGFFTETLLQSIVQRTTQFKHKNLKPEY